MDQKLDSVRCYREKKAETILRTVTPSAMKAHLIQPTGRKEEAMPPPLHLSGAAGWQEENTLGWEGRRPVRSLSRYLSNSQ